jgi:hypothetical protein
MRKFLVYWSIIPIICCLIGLILSNYITNSLAFWGWLNALVATCILMFMKIRDFKNKNREIIISIKIEKPNVTPAPPKKTKD